MPNVPLVAAIHNGYLTLTMARACTAEEALETLQGVDEETWVPVRKERYRKWERGIVVARYLDNS